MNAFHQVRKQHQNRAEQSRRVQVDFFTLSGTHVTMFVFCYGDTLEPSAPISYAKGPPRELRLDEKLIYYSRTHSITSINTGNAEIFVLVSKLES